MSPVVARHRFLSRSLEHASLRRNALTVLLATCMAWCGPFSCGHGGEVSFPSGVASGDITPDEALVWTAVEGADTVRLEVSRNPEFQDIEPGGVGFRKNVPVRDGLVKAVLTGLESHTRYFYRFSAHGIYSRPGTFVTPPADHAPEGFTFAFSGDSNAVFRPFTLLSSVLADNPSFFVYLGDTIYSDDTRNPMAPAFTVSEYDHFYRENKDDADLQNLLAATSVMAVWDDHEVTNDYAGTVVDAVQMENGLTSFLRNFPVRDNPDEPLRLYRSFRWGGAAEFFLLDERQYRSEEHICVDADGTVQIVPDAACLQALSAPNRTFLGDGQKAWLKNKLLASNATFKFIVSQLPISEFRVLPYDRWEGYPEERREILDFINDHDIADVYFLSADIHANFLTAIDNDIYEFITGPIATDTLQDAADWVKFAVSPDLLFALFFPSVEFHAIDRYGYGLITVQPDTVPPSFRIQIKGIGGDVLYSAVFVAKE